MRRGRIGRKALWVWSFPACSGQRVGGQQVRDLDNACAFPLSLWLSILETRIET
jgi:hypothetical protein